MKFIRVALALLVCAVILQSVHAQDKQQDAKGTEGAAKTESQALSAVKVQVVLAEFDGDKKISSMPYVLHATTKAGAESSIRLDDQVPVGNNYQSVDTDIDCDVAHKGEERYEVHLRIRRSSFSQDTSQEPVRLAPTRRTSSYEARLIMQDGQTAEAASGVDPTTGHVIKAEVTLSVLK